MKTNFFIFYTKIDFLIIIIIKLNFIINIISNIIIIKL